MCHTRPEGFLKPGKRRTQGQDAACLPGAQGPPCGQCRECSSWCGQHCMAAWRWSCCPGASQATAGWSDTELQMVGLRGLERRLHWPFSAVSSCVCSPDPALVTATAIPGPLPRSSGPQKASPLCRSKQKPLDKSSLTLAYESTLPLCPATPKSTPICPLLGGLVDPSLAPSCIKSNQSKSPISPEANTNVP